MALSDQTKAWLEDLKTSGGLTDEAFNAIKATFEGNSKADEFVKGSALRQADYSRVMSEVQKAQKDVEAAGAALTLKEQQVTAYQQELGTWKAGADVNFRKAIQEREAAGNKAAAAVARLKSLAVANGLSEEDILKDLEVAPVAEKSAEHQQFDTSEFVKRSDIQQTVRESALIDASIHDVAVRHLELTGKPLKDAAKLVSEAIAAKMTIGDYAAKKYDYAKLEGEASEAAVQRRIDEAVKARETQILSDAGLPNAGTGLRTDLKGSPLFTDGPLKAPTGDGGGGISAAVAAFNSGKFAAKR
jgi:hypothetical protein